MPHSNQRGSVPIYVALLTVTILTSASLALASILARQIQNTENIIDSERAYYAATSGAEEALWILVQNNAEGSPPNVPLEISGGVVPYDGGRQAEYNVKAILKQHATTFVALPCIDSVGEYSGNQRRLVQDQVSVDCEF